MYCFCTYNSEVSVIYAYDIEHMESICAEVFPGNSIDARSYPAFIRNNDIRKGMLLPAKSYAKLNRQDY